MILPQGSTGTKRAIKVDVWAALYVPLGTVQSAKDPTTSKKPGLPFLEVIAANPSENPFFFLGE